MIPDTTTITTNGDNVVWKNRNFIITVDEAREIAEKISKLTQSSNIRSLVVDNRECQGTWPKEVAQIWNQLMGTLIKNIERCATISNGVLNKSHINRLSNETGTSHIIQAFTTEKEAYEFIRS